MPQGSPEGLAFALLMQKSIRSLIDELCEDAILVPCGGAVSYLFLHLTFQEYLAARHLARKANKLGWGQASVMTAETRGPVLVRVLADKKVWDPIWEEVIVLLSGQLDEPRQLLEMLGDPDGDDHFRHRLGLAAQCLPEIDEALRDSEPTKSMVDRVTTEAFLAWWDSLLEGRSSTVPHLARSLPALARSNGRVIRDRVKPEVGGPESEQ